MASSTVPPASLSPEFAAAFRREAGGGDRLRFDAFMRLALYDPGLGYYRRDRRRVGRDRSADFYTATSLGPIFGELVAAACSKLLREANLDPAAHAFVEIGAEPSGGVLDHVAAHPFAATRALRLGDELALAGRCVVFSNELFDAQPVRRFVRREACWHELGVALGPAYTLAEADLGPAPEDVFPHLPPLAETPTGYQFDAPLAAADLAARLASEPWEGLFVAFDYGKFFAELAHSVPGGTLRAYHRHEQEKDLLARPGEQDLTAHVCWDWLLAPFAAHAPTAHPPGVVSQESFFMHHAGEHLATVFAREARASLASPAKRALMHLLHPAQMGQKFQVLHALKIVRSPAAPSPL